MKITFVESLAEPVGNIWKQLQAKYTKEKGSFSVASPLSSTPLTTYQWIVDHAQSFENWNKTKFVLMDEQVEGESQPFRYILTDDPASYERFARVHLLDPLEKRVGVSLKIIKPDLKTISEFQTDIDLLILALGIKGNYANVMPGTSLETSWHVTHLLEEFSTAHTKKGSKSYAGAEFRGFGMSLGPQQVLEAQNIVVIISGSHKKDLAKQLLLHKTFDPEFPLSIVYHLKVKDRVQLFVTKDAM